MKKLKRTEKGQSLVELAVSFTLLLIILGGVIDLGRIFFAFIAIRDAAEEGASYASIAETKTPANVISRIKSSATSPIDLNDLPSGDILVKYYGSGGIEKDSANACSGDVVTVEVTYYHTFIMPLTTAFTGDDPLPVTSKITNTVLYPLCP